MADINTFSAPALSRHPGSSEYCIWIRTAASSRSSINLQINAWASKESPCIRSYNDISDIIEYIGLTPIGLHRYPCASHQHLKWMVSIEAKKMYRHKRNKYSIILSSYPALKSLTMSAHLCRLKFCTNKRVKGHRVICWSFGQVFCPSFYVPGSNKVVLCEYFTTNIKRGAGKTAISFCLSILLL